MVAQIVYFLLQLEVFFSFVEGTSLPQSLLPLCDDLRSVITALEYSYNKMQRWDEAMTGISELLDSQNKTEDVIFQVILIS